MKAFLRGLFAVLLLAAAPALAQQAASDWAGDWDVTATYGPSSSGSGRLTLAGDAAAVTGQSQPLDENQFFPLTFSGAVRSGAVELDGGLSDGRKVGRLKLRVVKGELVGEGELYGTPVRIAGRRPATAVGGAIIEVQPKAFALQYSSRAEPVQVLKSGDRVRTTLLDNEGQDGQLRFRGMPGNTLTGPFVIEGAMPGDTLVVRIDRIVLNRDTASMYGGMLSGPAVGAGYEQAPTKGWSRTWILDRETGEARLKEPGDRLAGLRAPLKPMIGSIGVAPPLNLALYAGDLGPHGGNLDYNRIVEGVTLYFPVFRAGGYLFLGDGHALQGDGEITGQGLETSMDVEFTVTLVKGPGLGLLWMEDAQDVMVMGVDNSLELALQRATTGLAAWLKSRYGLNDSEIATLLGAVVEYDIAEIVDGRQHVVARIAKRYLAMIRMP